MESQIKLIVDERKRQDEKWGADRNLDDTTWLTILMEEVGETCEAILKGLPSMQTELVQVGAVALAWLECVDRRRRTLRAPDTGRNSAIKKMVLANGNEATICDEIDHEISFDAGYRYCPYCAELLRPVISADANPAPRG